MEHQCFANKCFFLFFILYIDDKVDCAANRLSSLKIRAVFEFRIIITEEKIATDLKLLEKLWISNLRNVRVAIILLIASCIVIHGTLQCGRNTHIIHDKTAFLISEDTVNPSDCLHQIMAGHWFIDIHGRK